MSAPDGSTQISVFFLDEGWPTIAADFSDKLKLCSGAEYVVHDNTHGLISGEIDDNSRIILLVSAGSFSWVEVDDLKDKARKLNPKPMVVLVQLRHFDTTLTGLQLQSDPVLQEEAKSAQRTVTHAWSYRLPCLMVNPKRLADVKELNATLLDMISPNANTSQSVWKRVGGWVLDRIAQCFSLPTPPLKPKCPDAALPDAETAVTLWDSEEAIAWGQGWTSQYEADAYADVRKITERLVAKGCEYPKGEMTSLNFVMERTTIPVPRPYLPEGGFLMLDLIEGDMLSKCWDTLTPFMRFRVACTIRTYITQLRRLQSLKPGPLDGPIRGALFEMEKCHHSFADWFWLRMWCEALARKGWLVLANISKEGGRPFSPTLPPPFSRSLEFRPLVFTHGDLHPGNLILSPAGHLWVIDWEDSGFYPIWFERLAIDRYEDSLPKSWNRLRWFMAGSFPGTSFFWRNFRPGLHFGM